MDRFKFICSIILVITVPIVIITLSQNIIFRLPDVYLFYFNDSQVVGSIYTSLTGSEIADGIAGFFNSFRPAEFQIYEDTGYDLQGIFDSGDSYNMLILKRGLDVSCILGVAALIFTVAIYIFFLKKEEKKTLRKTFRISLGISVVLIFAQAVVMSADNLRAVTCKLLGLRTLAEDSNLLAILGGDFWNMAVYFITGMAVIVLLLVTYANYRLTKPPRIFY